MVLRRRAAFEGYRQQTWILHSFQRVDGCQDGLFQNFRFLFITSFYRTGIGWHGWERAWCIALFLCSCFRLCVLPCLHRNSLLFQRTSWTLFLQCDIFSLLALQPKDKYFMLLLEFFMLTLFLFLDDTAFLFLCYFPAPCWVDG